MLTIRSAPRPAVASRTASAKSAARLRRATSSPSGTSAASFSEEPEVPMTCASSTFAELQRGHAHARGDAVDQQPLAGLQPPLQHQHVVGDQEGQRECSPLRPRRARGHGHRLGRLHQRELGEGAGAAAHDPVSGPKAPRPGADRDHLARTLAADRLPASRLAVQAVAEQELAAVERGGAHPHQKLRRPGHRHGRVAPLQRRGAVGHLHPPRLHDGHLRTKSIRRPGLNPTGRAALPG